MTVRRRQLLCSFNCFLYLLKTLACLMELRTLRPVLRVQPVSGGKDLASLRPHSPSRASSSGVRAVCAFLLRHPQSGLRARPVVGCAAVLQCGPACQGPLSLPACCVGSWLLRRCLLCWGCWPGPAHLPWHGRPGGSLGLLAAWWLRPVAGSSQLCFLLTSRGCPVRRLWPRVRLPGLETGPPAAAAQES